MRSAAIRRSPDATLGAAVAHPLRCRCLTILADRVASPAEIARELGLEVSNVGYHVGALAEAGLIEEVGQRPVRGAVEHFYRAVVRPITSTEDGSRASIEQRRLSFARTTWSLITANATTALAGGHHRSSARTHHLTRVPLRVDEQGWSEMAEAYMELYERVYEIQADAAERLGKTPDDPGISVLSVLAFFETPEAAPAIELAAGDGGRTPPRHKIGAMPIDIANADLLLSTTRSVRKRLDFDRPVEREVLLECLQLAVQAPTASNSQTWRWMIVTDPDLRLQVADYYRAAALPYLGESLADAEGGGDATQQRVYDCAVYLAENMEKAPALVIPCIAEDLADQDQTGTIVALGSVVQAAWSFQLALRARGLGSCWTTLHLRHAAEVAELLGIPAGFTQVSLIPVAYTKGTDFKPAKRGPVSEITHWDHWDADGAECAAGRLAGPPRGSAGSAPR